MLSTATANDLLGYVGNINKGLSRTAGDNAMIVKGKGSYVEMNDGRRLLDFTTGIGVTALGEHLDFRFLDHTMAREKSNIA
jgi:4-aminobutyrate aminotransferase-like enzyme